MALVLARKLHIKKVGDNSSRKRRKEEMETAQKAKPILVVEDESIMRESLRDWLAEAGYHVETAEEGEKALKAIAERDFGLLILDLRLPGTGGIDLLRQARAKRPQLKGIIITAYPSVQTAVEAMKEGAIDYLTKPFDLNRLEESIRSTLGPVQVQIRPKVAAEKTVVTEPGVTAVGVPTSAPEAPGEIPEQLRNIDDKSALIQMLLAIQKENRWLSNDALAWVSQKLGVPLTQIYHIATFYKAFSLKPQGRHSVSVCMGTACHVRGAVGLLDKTIDTLKIKPGETSRDMRFSLNTVNCLGCCALGPVLMVDGKYHSNPSASKLKEIFESCK
jgi:NADH-quinone oxidoreductase subunit E